MSKFSVSRRTCCETRITYDKHSLPGDDLSGEYLGLRSFDSHTVALDPSLDWAQAALIRVWYRWRRESWEWLIWPAVRAED